MSQSMPRQVGKYEIIKKLGHGGFGDVYLAKDTMLGSNVAVKILAPIYMRDPTVVKRFQQEARAAAGLRHPNIVRIYDLGQDQGLLYLAMDYLPGRTLARIIHDDGPLPLDQVSNTLSQIASALDYAHAKGLIHRDVKPGNVVVDESAHATLTDFGLVKAVDHTQFTILSHTTGGEQFTTGGSAIGTPEYMAPEQADPALGAVGPHTDLYALGVMTYQMIAGRVPFQASTPVATLRAHADLEPPPLAEWSDVPEGVAGVVAKALAKQPGDRWSSAGQLARAFSDAVERNQTAAALEVHLAGLYAQATDALVDRRWARALGLSGQIIEQAPTYRKVGDLFEQANAGLAHQRAWEAQQAELAALYDQATEHLATGDLDNAILLLTEIVDTSDEYAYRDAPKKLAEAKQAREQAEAKRQARIEILQEEALAAQKRCRELLGKLQQLEPENIQVPILIQRVDDIIGEWCSATELLPSEEAASDEEQTPTAEDDRLDPVEVTEAKTEEPKPAGALEADEAVMVPTPDTELLERPQPPDLEPRMVQIPSGDFLMGSALDDLAASSAEKPQHRIRLKAYWIGCHPVTNRQYAVFVRETGHTLPSHWRKAGRNCGSLFPEDEADHPVVYVRWEDAVEYCHWLSRRTNRVYRLPTEAEWERAARGNSGQRYPWGDEPPDAVRSNFNSKLKQTTPVGAFSPAGDSPFGCADMAGNVFEWCADWYQSDYYRVSPNQDPQGPNEGQRRVARGGGWYSNSINLHSAYRASYLPGDSSNFLGFRCAANANPKTDENLADGTDE